MKMNEKKPENLKDRLQESRMPGMNMMMGMMIACCAAILAFSLITGGGLGWFLGRSNTQPVNLPKNSSQPQQ